MRCRVPGAVLLAVVALAGAAAALPAASSAGEEVRFLGGAVPAVPTSEASAVDIPTGPASPAWPAAAPSDVPALTGPASVVGRAAILLAPGGVASQGVDPALAATLAAEQQLIAKLEPLGSSPWQLGRVLPPMPSLPAASMAPEPVLVGLGAPAQAAVVAVGAAGVVALLFPKVPLLPLYSRIEREEAMLNSRRAQLYELVRAEPGIHLSDLVRRAGLGWGAALYHLGVLEKNRMLVAHAEGGFKRYFANGMHPRTEMHRFAALRHEASRALFEAVQASPGRSGRELAASLDLSPSTLARASDRLEEAGLVRRVRAGRRVLYFPAEPAAAQAPPAAMAAA